MLGRTERGNNYLYMTSEHGGFSSRVMARRVNNALSPDQGGRNGL